MKSTACISYLVFEKLPDANDSLLVLERMRWERIKTMDRKSKLVSFGPQMIIFHILISKSRLPDAIGLDL